MKKVALLLTLLISINLSAQETTKTKTLFVRVFDLDGKKIGKGHIYAMNDSPYGANIQPKESCGRSVVTK